MSNTYCGNSCVDCEYKEELKCPGCKMGPGRDLSNECELAYCCRSKGHKTCATCEIKSRCGKYINKGKAAKERIENNKADTERKKSLSAMAEFLENKIKILFFFLILSNVFSVIADVFLSEAVAVSTVITCILSAGYGIVLIIISRADRKFLISGLLIFAVVIINILVTFVVDASAGMRIFIAIIVFIITLVSEYHEFMGHSDVLMAYERDLCDKWVKIWNWYVISLIATVLGTLLGIALIVLVTSVISLVLGVLKIVYLYQTAEVYRQYYWFNQ